MEENHKTKITHNGHDYTYNDTQAGFHRYRCSHRRRGCKATVKVSVKDNQIVVGSISHSCNICLVSVSDTVDAKNEMIEMARELGISRRGVPARQIWADVNSAIDDKYVGEQTVVIKSTKKKVIDEVGEVRRSEGAGDMFDKVCGTDHRFLSNIDRRRFLQIAIRYPLPNDRIDEQLHQLLMWSHPELLPMLRRTSIHLLLDGTFRIVPKPFTQCLIFMMHDDETELFVPIVYCLVDSKSQWTYWHALHFLIVLTETKINPATITTDFELPLFQAVAEQFPKAARIGCSFHFKQALRRKLVDLRIPEEQIHKAMQPEQLDTLQRTQKPDLARAIEILKQELGTKETAHLWEEFFVYFQKTWIQGSIPIDMWNMVRQSDDCDCTHFSTNNALENFNRQLNAAFPSPHPNIFCFIETIKKISITKLAEIKDIKEQGGRKLVRKKSKY